MRTINKFTTLTDSQREQLKEAWITNWIGWQWGFDFDKLLERIWRRKNFKKVNNLHKDIRVLADEHDFSFWKWNTIKWFLKANKDFVVWVIGLLHWSSSMARLIISVPLFLWLTIFGIRYYNWRAKRRFIFKS